LAKSQCFWGIHEVHGFRRLFYIVHSPSKDLKELDLNTDKEVELWFAKEISEKVLNHGLLEWLIDKIK
jgi:hypothetical protein